MSFLSKLVENDLVNIPVVNAPYHRVIEGDFAKNHVGREYTVQQAKAGFDIYKANGGLFVANDTSIIIYRQAGDDSIEFHTMNCGTGLELAQLVVQFLKDIADDAKTAVTFYDNEKINSLFCHSPCKVKFERIDGGEDRTFMATFNLREAA